ncbi:MAG: helix-turn-helix domain-containing protein [Planctomyces sp.]
MRIQRGLTQRQLAKVSGHTERLIRKGKKGVRLDNTTVQNLAEALSQFGENVSVSSLLQDNPATAELWVQGFDRFGKRRCS